MYFFYTIFVEYSHKCELIAEILLMKEYKEQYRKLTCFFNDREVREVCRETKQLVFFSTDIVSAINNKSENTKQVTIVMVEKEVEARSL